MRFMMMTIPEGYAPDAAPGSQAVSEEDGVRPVVATSKEVIGGYWNIQVRSREAMSNNERIEVRQIHEMSDFPEDVRKAVEGFEQLTR